MIDFNSYLSGEVRHLAFQKSTNRGMWQDAMRQQQADEIENRLGKSTKSSRLVDLSNTVLHQFSNWKQNILTPHEDPLKAERRLMALGNKVPANRHPG